MLGGNLASQGLEEEPAILGIGHDFSLFLSEFASSLTEIKAGLSYEPGNFRHPGLINSLWMFEIALKAVHDEFETFVRGRVPLGVTIWQYWPWSMAMARPPRQTTNLSPQIWLTDSFAAWLLTP
jgi:hypothetical protein